MMAFHMVRQGVFGEVLHAEGGYLHDLRAIKFEKQDEGLWRRNREHFPADAPERRERYAQGDVNTSLIKTARGKTVTVQHCTDLPRPYSRINLVRGTKGMFQG